MGIKKMLSVALFCGALSFSSIFALADTGSESVASATADSSVLAEDGYTYEVDVTAKTATITGYTGTETELVIPETIGGYKVTTIGNDAFYQNLNITSVTVPSTITKIGDYAFGRCKNLAEIILKKGTEDAIIGEYAFAYIKVTDITIPGNYKKISFGAFYETTLTNITYESSGSKEPDQTIETHAFYSKNVYKPIVVRLSSSVGEIATYAFARGLSHKFYGELGSHAFQYADKWGLDFYEGSGVSGEYSYDYIGDEASISGYVGSSTSINIPTVLAGYKVTEIGDYAFYRTDIVSVTLPSTITEIGNYAFYSTDIISVTLPSAITKIEYKAFEWCKSLKYVELKEGKNNAVIETNAFYGTAIDSITIPGNYKEIGIEAFGYCSKLKSFVYNASLSLEQDQKILRDVFYKSHNLESVTLSSSILEIDDNAFDDCDEVKFYGDFNEYIINYGKENDIDCVTGSGVTESGYSYDISFGKAVITGYTGDETNLVIPSTLDGYEVEKIGHRAFINNTSIEHLTLSEGISIVGVRAFLYSYIKSVNLPSTITKIDKRAFYECWKLEEINLTKGTKAASVEEEAFRCAITSLNIPANYIYIKKNAFECSDLVKVIFENDGVSREGQYLSEKAFKYCYSLEIAVIPENITGVPEISSYTERLFEESSLVTIYGNEGSAAQAYANEYSIPFVAYENSAVLKSNVLPVIAIGDTVTLDASESTGYGELKYQYLMHNKDTDKWTAVTGTSSSYTWVANVVGNVEFFVKVKDETGLVITSSAVATNIKSELAKLEFTASCDKTNFFVGEKIKITADVTSGEAPYTYSYIMHNKKNDTWYKYYDGEFVEHNYIIRENIAAGCYEFFVKVKDASGRIVTSEAINIDIYEPMTGEFTVNDKTTGHTLAVGENVVLKADAMKGGSGDYTYKFVMYDKVTGKWSTLRNYAKGNTYTYELQTAGDKTFKVHVKDGKGNETSLKNIYVNVAEALNAKLTLDTSLFEEGESVKISVDATGGYGPYTYTYLVYDKENNKWSTIKSNSTSNEYIWQATSAGTKVFHVDVYDSTGARVRCKSGQVTCVEPLLVSAAASMKTSFVGDKVKFTVEATGGSDSYKYSYIVYNKTTGKWARLKDKITSNAYTWTAKSEGIRVFYVEVTDANGKTVRSEGITVTTKENVPEVVLTATKSSVSAGASIKLTATATEGKAPYTYSFLVYNFTTKKWYRFNEGEFLKSNTKTWKASGTGKRKFFVEVKDANGKVVRSEGITITIK